MKRNGRAATIAVILAAVVLVTLIGINRDRFTPLDVGSRAPEYAALTLGGDTVRLSSFAGNVVLLNIWATWCLPCVREMPALQRLHEQLGDRGLSIVAVSVDEPSALRGGVPGLVEEVREFARGFDLTFTVLYDPSGGIQSRYQVNGLPTTFIIDRDGRIHRKVLGAAEWDEPPFVEQIRSMLEG